MLRNTKLPVKKNKWEEKTRDALKIKKFYTKGENELSSFVLFLVYIGTFSGL